MKTMYVDTSVRGHHIPYMVALIKISDDYYCFLPSHVNEISDERQIVNKYNYKNLFGYLFWILKIKRIAKQHKINTIHFLYGDIFYRFFGLGLVLLREYNLIVTFHHIRKGTLHDISLKRIFRHINYGVVHTKALLDYAKNKGITNISSITYPVFEDIHDIGKSQSCEYLSISTSLPTLLCFGGTRYDKGLDIMLEALSYINAPVQIIIAGKEEYFSKEFIENKMDRLSVNYHINLNFIREKDISMYFSACDYVVLPYRQVFDGASGPLGIGCLLNKTIIGPSHGSLGEIIKNNHLGFVFKSESAESLAQTINYALASNFTYDETAEKYRNQLDVGIFVKRYNKVLNL